VTIRMIQIQSAKPPVIRDRKIVDQNL